jgi:basic amino acid/polyamine antiporter, APA family
MKLKKEIGLFGGISILAGIMIGSGIFVFGNLVLARSGYALGLSILAWLIGGVITLFSALTYAELGTMFPETGGYYVYLKRAYGQKIAFLSGLMNFVLTSSGSIALLAVIFADILLNFVLGVNSYILIRLVAAMSIIVLSLTNYLGIKVGSLVQKIFLVAKIIPLLAMIVIGFTMGGERVVFSFSPVESVNVFGYFILIAYAVVGTLWAYEGWTNLNTVTGEMKNVKKDLPKALFIAVTLVTVIYVLFIIALYRILSLETLQALTLDQYFPIVAMMTLFGESGMLFVLIAVLISVFGALNGSIMVFPRVYFAMAEDQTFFKAFKHLDQKHKTPSFAILGSALMALVLIFFDVENLLTFVVFGGLIFNTLIFFSVYLFRRREKELERPYQVLGYPYVPAIAILGMLLLLVAVFIESPINSLIGVFVLILGYFIFDRVFKNK